MAGPKPREGGRGRTVGVVVSPELDAKLDALFLAFLEAQKYLPDWFKVPTTKSAATAWLIERVIDDQLHNVQLMVRETKGILGVLYHPINVDEATECNRIVAMSDEIAKSDDYLLSLRAALASNRKKLMESLYPHDLE